MNGGSQRRMRDGAEEEEKHGVNITSEKGSSAVFRLVG